MVEPPGPAASNTPAVDRVGNGVVPGSGHIDIFNADEFNEEETRAQLLFDRKNDPMWSCALEEWEKTRDRIERKISARNDLYQWIWFFIVFQAEVLLALALSSTLGCQQSWAPASLSLIASLVTVVTVHFKLINYDDLNANLFKRNKSI